MAALQDQSVELQSGFREREMTEVLDMNVKLLTETINTIIKLEMIIGNNDYEAGLVDEEFPDDNRKTELVRTMQTSWTDFRLTAKSVINHSGETISSLNEQKSLLENQIVEWKNAQRLNSLGGSNSDLFSSLEQMGTLFNKLENITLFLHRQLSQCYYAIVDFNNDRREKECCQLIEAFKTMLDEMKAFMQHLTKCGMIIVEEPPNSVRPNSIPLQNERDQPNSYATELRFLAGERFNLLKANLKIEALLISDKEAQSIGDDFDPSKTLNHKSKEAPIIHHPTCYLKVTDGNTSGTCKIKFYEAVDQHSGNNEGTQPLYHLLFRFKLMSQTNLLTYPYWTFSFPFAIKRNSTSNANDIRLSARIFWRLAVPIQKNGLFTPLREDRSLPWCDFFKALNLWFKKIPTADKTGYQILKRGLDEYEGFLKQELGLDIDVGDDCVTWNMFCQRESASLEVVFWDWMYLTKAYIAQYPNYWEDGILLGFASQSTVESILSQASTPSLVLTFSRSQPGKIVVNYLENKLAMHILLDEPENNLLYGNDLFKCIKRFPVLQNIVNILPCGKRLAEFCPEMESKTPDWKPEILDSKIETLHIKPNDSKNELFAESGADVKRFSFEDEISSENTQQGNDMQTDEASGNNCQSIEEKLQECANANEQLSNLFGHIGHGLLELSRAGAKLDTVLNGSQEWNDCNRHAEKLQQWHQQNMENLQMVDHNSLGAFDAVKNAIDQQISTLLIMTKEWKHTQRMAILGGPEDRVNPDLQVLAQTFEKTEKAIHSFWLLNSKYAINIHEMLKWSNLSPTTQKLQQDKTNFCAQMQNYIQLRKYTLIQKSFMVYEQPPSIVRQRAAPDISKKQKNSKVPFRLELRLLAGETFGFGETFRSGVEVEGLIITEKQAQEIVRETLDPLQEKLPTPGALYVPRVTLEAPSVQSDGQMSAVFRGVRLESMNKRKDEDSDDMYHILFRTKPFRTIQADASQSRFWAISLPFLVITNPVRQRNNSSQAVMFWSHAFEIDADTSLRREVEAVKWSEFFAALNIWFKKIPQTEIDQCMSILRRGLEDYEMYMKDMIGCTGAMVTKDTFFQHRCEFGLTIWEQLLPVKDYVAKYPMYWDTGLIHGFAKRPEIEDMLNSAREPSMVITFCDERPGKIVVSCINWRPSKVDDESTECRNDQTEIEHVLFHDDEDDSLFANRSPAECVRMSPQLKSISRILPCNKPVADLFVLESKTTSSKHKEGYTEEGCIKPRVEFRWGNASSALSKEASEESTKIHTGKESKHVISTNRYNSESSIVDPPDHYFPSYPNSYSSIPSCPNSYSSVDTQESPITENPLVQQPLGVFNVFSPDAPSTVSSGRDPPSVPPDCLLNTSWESCPPYPRTMPENSEVLSDVEFRAAAEDFGNYILDEDMRREVPNS